MCGGKLTPRKEGHIMVSGDVTHSRCACTRVKTVSSSMNHRSSEELKWDFVKEMEQNISLLSQHDSCTVKNTIQKIMKTT